MEEESEDTIGRKEPSSREHKLKGKEKGRCPFARKAKRKGGAHCQGRCPLAREAAPTTSPAHRWIDQSAPDINHPTAPPERPIVAAHFPFSGPVLQQKAAIFPTSIRTTQAASGCASNSNRHQTSPNTDPTPDPPQEKLFIAEKWRQFPAIINSAGNFRLRCRRLLSSPNSVLPKTHSKSDTY